MTFLIEGEKLIKRFGQSRLVQIKLYLAAAALFLIPVVYNFYFSKVKLPFPDMYLIAVPAAFGLILILMAEFKTRLGSYYITNYRVISVKGSFRKTMDSCTYDKIVNVKIMQSLIQRILGMGTIDITTYQKTEILLGSISNPTKIERLIYSAMEKQSQQQPRAESRPPAQQPQYQPPPAQQPQYQPQPTPSDQQSRYPPQTRPLLASERQLMQQPPPGRPPEQPMYQPAIDQQPQSQPAKRKRFKIF